MDLRQRRCGRGRRNSVAFPSGLHDRARDAWEVLLATGEIAGDEWAGSTGRVYRACEAVTAEVDPETGAPRNAARRHTGGVQGRWDPEHLPTGKSGDEFDATAPAILPALIAKEGRPWPEWPHGRPLSPRGLASLLKDFGIASSTIRTSSKSTPKGYKRSAFERHWKLYGIGTSADSSNLSATTPQTAVHKGFMALASATDAHSVADVKLGIPLPARLVALWRMETAQSWRITHFKAIPARSRTNLTMPTNGPRSSNSTLPCRGPTPSGWPNVNTGSSRESSPGESQGHDNAHGSTPTPESAL